MRLRPRAVAPLVVAAAAIGVGGCGASAPTLPSATPTTSVVPIDATPWPNGTVGTYGLRIDPSLLKLIPARAGGLPVAESPELETPPLESADTVKTIEALASARIARVSDPDWAVVTVMRLQPDSTGDDAYGSLVSEYASGACSQAGGPGLRATAEIGERSVAVVTCQGGVTAYVLRLDERTVVAAMELGPRKLGRQLIAAIP